MIQQPQLDFLRYQIFWLRDLNFMASYANPSNPEAEDLYNVIWQRVSNPALKRRGFS